MPSITDLSIILETLGLIETKHKNGNDWVITLILNIYKNYIEVRQVEKYLTSVLMIGDKLQCKYITKDLIYLIDAEVYNIKFASSSVVLKVSNIKSLENNRTQNRYDVYLSSSFSRENSIGEYYCVTVNVSLSGLSIISKRSLELDETINVSIYFNSYNFLMVKCSVKWVDKSNDNNLYGLSIIEMDEISKSQYNNYIKKLKHKEYLLRKKGEKLW